MTKKQWRWMAIAFIAIAIVATAMAVWFAWPKETAVSAMPEEQNPTVLPAASADPACCQTTFVDLQDAPKGVWSNASGILIPEKWCVVLQRDQRWQQTRDEVELRQTWEQGATEDYLLLCSSVGSGYYSLEGEYGGRPRDWWNDEVKRVWAFPDPTAAVCRPGIIVLYENDDSSNHGWLFEIPVGTVR